MRVRRVKKIGTKLIYRRWVRKNGKIIYPKTAKCFVFEVKV